MSEFQEITADTMRYNVRTGHLETGGETELIGRSGQRMTLIDAYLSEDVAHGRSMRFELSPSTIATADAFRRNGDVTEAERVTFTACHVCDDSRNAWEIHARRMIHDAEAKSISFHHAWFHLYGVPAVYFPYMSHPDPTVRYKSGLLIPEFGAATNMGTQLNIPVYINFSDHHDMTVTGVYFANENPLLMLEHRLKTNHGEFETDASFTHSQMGINRWHMFHNNTVELGENMRFIGQIQRASDQTFLQQYMLYEDQPFLESSARLEIFGKQGYMTVKGNMFQELRQEIDGAAPAPGGDILPQIHGVYQTELTSGIYGQFTGDLMRVGDMREGWAANRAIGEARVVAPIDIAASRVTFSVAARNDFYQYDNVAGAIEGTASRFLPSGYVDWEMPFVRAGESFTQIIKPKARVTSMGSADNASFMNMDSAGAILTDAALFANNRFPGYDMWMSGTYVDYGLSWVGYDSSGWSVEAFIGQTYDINTDSDIVDINSGFRPGASDIVGRFGVSPTENLAFTNRFRLAQDGLGLRHMETDVRVGDRNFISLGYIWAVQFEDATFQESNTMSEGMIGGGLHLSERLSARATGIYNFTYNRPQRYDVGVYYEHPCYTFGLVYTVDNAIRIFNVGGENLNFYGVAALRFVFSVNMGQPAAAPSEFANGV